MSPIIDDGTRPFHTYAELIGMAIMRAPRRRLTVGQICKWISDHFSYYEGQERYWQNEVGRRLCIDKSFVKHKRPKHHPGKGRYWSIVPGDEARFLFGEK